MATLPVTAQETPEGEPAPEIELQAPADAAIQERIEAVFARIEEFRRVAPEVADGVVILRGEAPTPGAAQRAEEITSRFEGVIFVSNQIEAATDIETRVAPAIDRVQYYLNRFFALLPVILVAILIILFFWLISKLLGRWEAPASRFRNGPMTWHLLRRILRALIVLLGLVLAFDVLGISTMVGALLGTAGILGIVLGFAFQDIAENYLAGALLSVRQPFSVNDIIRIGEHEGRVVRMTSRELVLFTHDGNHLQLPNAHVFKSIVINFTRNPRRRFTFPVGVGVEEDLVRAMRIGVGALAGIRGVMEDPKPFALIMDLAESTVTVMFHGWVDQRSANWIVVRSEAIRLVKKALEDAGVAMPEPIYNLRVSRHKEVPPQEAPPPDLEEDEALEGFDPDRALDAQIAEDIATTDEENLLTKQPGGKKKKR